MDTSKLPKFSSTPPRPVASDEPAPSASFCTECGAPLPTGMKFCGGCGRRLDDAVTTDRASVVFEAFFAIAIGLILLLVVPTTLQYASSKLLHTRFAPFVDPFTNKGVDYVTYTNGTRTPYRQLINFWSDLVITLFAVVLVLDGIVLLLVRRRSIMFAAAAFTSLATLANLAYLVGSYSRYGLAVLSAVAVVFGAYLAFRQWQAATAAR